MKRGREASQANDKNDEDALEKENKEKKNSKAAEDGERDTPDDGKSEDEDRSKLPQVVGDENKKAILVDPRGWARERLATALREKGKDLEQKENRSHWDEPTKSGQDCFFILSRVSNLQFNYILIIISSNQFGDMLSFLTSSVFRIGKRKSLHVFFVLEVKVMV